MGDEKSRVLLVDDEASILSVLKTLLTVEGYDVVPVQDGRQAVEILKSEDFDIMISDIRMTPVNGMELLKLAHETRPSMAVIMVTAFGSVETAVEAIKMGAYDYVLKPFKIDELLITVDRALNYKRAISENVDLKAQVKARYRFDSIVAESDAMRKVCEMIEHLAPTDTTLLITGEKGTGKALVAKTVHDQSPRKDEAFFAIDCSKLAEEDLETTLFKGGRASTHDPEGKGLLIAAGRGTVYLDKIGGMSTRLQSTLLQVLQDRNLNGQPVQARIMAGTDVDLNRLVKEAKFREDLHNRLRAISIDIKPLRERREDILPLVYRLLLAQVGEGNEVPSLAPDARMALMQYSWPENVGELDTALKHAFATAQGGEIKKEHIPEAVTKGVSAAGKKTGPGGPADEYRGKSLKAFLRSKEKEYLESVLDHTKGDKEKAAKALKISLATLYRKLPGDPDKEP